MDTPSDHSNLEAKIDASDYEDTLILFIIRLLDLQSKRYYREYKPPEPKIHWNEDETSITKVEIIETNVDSEYFISYLSVVRQFWANNDALNIHRIKGILLDAARRLQDSDLKERVKRLDKAFRERWNNGRYTYCDHTGNELVSFSHHELVNFWFNTVYFHTVPSDLEKAVPLFEWDGLRKWSRSSFEVYLHDLVRYVEDIGSEIMKILWKGCFPKGKLHRLLEMYVPLSTYIEERRRRAGSDAAAKT